MKHVKSSLLCVLLWPLAACMGTYEEVVVNAGDEQAILRVQNGNDLSAARSGRINTLLARALGDRDFDVLEIKGVAETETGSVRFSPAICGIVDVAGEGSYNFMYVEMHMDASLARASGMAQKGEVVSIDRAACDEHWDMEDLKYSYSVAAGP